MMYAVIAVLVLFLVIQVVSLWALFRPPTNSKYPSVDLPKISILLAARDEEKLILRSLKSIETLNYPKDCLQVLIGNDLSSDNTSNLITDFIRDKPNYTLVDIESNLGKSRGKANVLAHLAHQANGEFFFITDVDVELPSEWINELLNEFDTGVGIVSGTSTCAADKSIFSGLQSIDWLHFMGYIQSFANLGVACTSVGNNMAVRAKAYWETGGFEQIDFSITEDYKLFKEVTHRGWKWRTILTPGSLGLATHLDSWREMLHQRKRWLIGAGELPINWKALITLYGLFIPALTLMLFMNPIIALVIWSLKFIIQTVFVYQLAQMVGLKKYPLAEVFLYEFYVLFNTFVTAVFYFSPVKAVWKGRTYSHHDLN
jgi:cellulose synthase/poly-beta-1,6-N-acetylglucosamine synthase-like glycosyltransferase